MWVIDLCLFIIGIVLGSFYNVVGLRVPKNESLIKPRSHCVNCNHALNWYELIPVFSYIFLRGKCAKCKMPISPMYPLVELTSGLLFVISFHLFGFSYLTLISFVVVSLVLITIVSDCKYMVILDEVLVIAIILIGLFMYFGYGINYLLRHALAGVILFLILVSIKFIGDFSFKQESLGWGDVKLSFIAGYILGFKLGLVYLFLGAFLALPYAMFVTLKKKTNLIPFGPFLAVSMLIIFWNTGIFNQIIKILIGV